MSRSKARANGEGSIFPYRKGFGAYAWVTTPAGERKRKYVYGPTREAVHTKWVKLQEEASQRPVATTVPTLGEYMTYWLREVVEPNLTPATYANYEMFARLYIAPELGARRLDKLAVRDVQAWLNRLRQACQCCVQGKDARRAEAKRRCCARQPAHCCRTPVSERTARDAWTTLRNVLNNAIREELVSRNVAALVRVGNARTRKEKPWSVEEVRTFLESASRDRDPMYAAYVLILVLGLRRGEVLGLGWEEVNLDVGELAVGFQLQRVRRRLLRRATKTESSDATLPMPDICVTALRERQKQQEAHREAGGAAWHPTDLVLTTRYGTPIEPRNFTRSFKARCQKAGVRSIKVHTTRRTCASLLVALDVHPRVAMQILRHSQIAVTMNVYAEAPSPATRRALKRLGKQLGA